MEIIKDVQEEATIVEIWTIKIMYVLITCVFQFVFDQYYLKHTSHCVSQARVTSRK